jgi:hypothetical protein
MELPSLQTPQIRLSGERAPGAGASRSRELAGGRAGRPRLQTAGVTPGWTRPRGRPTIGPQVERPAPQARVAATKAGTSVTWSGPPERGPQPILAAPQPGRRRQGESLVEGRPQKTMVCPTLAGATSRCGPCSNGHLIFLAADRGCADRPSTGRAGERRRAWHPAAVVSSVRRLLFHALHRNGLQPLGAWACGRAMGWLRSAPGEFPA